MYIDLGGLLERKAIGSQRGKEKKEGKEDKSVRLFFLLVFGVG